jgi:hypothetical protein
MNGKEISFIKLNQDKRNDIIHYETNIDDFVNNSHNLLQVTMV